MANKREKDALDDFLDKHEYREAMRVTTWIKRFLHNARNQKANRVNGPLTSSEVEQAKLMWELRCQRDTSNSDTFQEERIQLHLQPNNESGLLECRGRVNQISQQGQAGRRGLHTGVLVQPDKNVLPNMETPEFIRSVKRFIARRGRKWKIYSDNARTWVKQVMHDERVQGFLTQQRIIWQLNLCRALWLGGQFERRVGLIKSAFYKSIGLLTWAELT